MAQAAAGFGGLVLVFLGGVAERFHSYEGTKEKAVLARFRARAWLATSGVLAAVAATGFGLGAEACASDGAAIASLAFLGLAVAVTVVAALITALEVR